jgi:hypothetical protein
MDAKTRHDLPCFRSHKGPGERLEPLTTRLQEGGRRILACLTPTALTFPLSPLSSVTTDVRVSLTEPLTGDHSY